MKIEYEIAFAQTKMNKMKKSEKKIKNMIISGLSEVCETVKLK